jgi:hypothetical protein
MRVWHVRELQLKVPRVNMGDAARDNYDALRVNYVHQRNVASSCLANEAGAGRYSGRLRHPSPRRSRTEQKNRQRHPLLKLVVHEI